MKYPIGIQTFSEIREGGYAYVDKTALIYELIQTGKYYFLSRPRRFGKSLLLSTLHAYFSGRRDLFEGLKISELEKDWTVYPVLRFDLNTGKYTDPKGVYDLLSGRLSEYEEEYGITKARITLSDRFRALIIKAYESTGQKVVVLIDEYDKPLLETLGNPTLQELYRADLKPFYGNIKSCDEYLRFAMLTGVTKLGHLSIFSDLNSPNDISMISIYATICGITAEEVSEYFSQRVLKFAESIGTGYEDMFSILKEEYDGYRFTTKESRLFNPYSLLCALYSLEINDYWFRTGTPSYIWHLLERNKYNLWELENKKVSFSVLSEGGDINHPIPLLYQSGYLTIKEYDPKFKVATLDFPNEEIRRLFISYLLPKYPRDNSACSGQF